MTSRTAVLRAAGGLAAALACVAVVPGCSGSPPDGDGYTPGASSSLPGAEYVNFDGEYLTDGGERRYEVMTIDGDHLTYAVIGCDGGPLVDTSEVTGTLDPERETITWTNPDGDTKTVDYAVRRHEGSVEIHLNGEDHPFHAAGSAGAQEILTAQEAECAGG